MKISFARPALGLTGSIRGDLWLADPPPALADALVKIGAFANPQYAAAVKYSPYGMPGRGIPAQLNLVYTEGSCLRVPRGLVAAFGLPAPLQAQWEQARWTDERVNMEGRFPRLRVALNAEQKKLLSNFEMVLAEGADTSFGAYLYVSPTGTGKTMAQAEMARRTGQRTLILFNTELVKQAWWGDLNRAYGLTTAEIGMIQQDRTRIAPHFTLASVQTLGRRRERWAEWFAQFGCLVMDEADLCPGPTVREFIGECPARYRIGATATPNHKGIAYGFYIPALFGPVARRISEQQKDTATALALKRVDTVSTAFRYAHERGATLDWHDLMTKIQDDPARNELICQQALKDWLAGESVLIVTRRVAHVHLLYQRLRALGVLDANVLTGATNQEKVYTEKLIEQVMARAVRLVIATVPAIKRGANLNPMSVLHLAMPVGSARDLEQLIGRVRRRAVNKQTCRLTYYLDVRMRYLHNLFIQSTSVFRRLRVPNYIERYYA
jgi:superfamily II DNA or RNA helicase